MPAAPVKVEVKNLSAQSEKNQYSRITHMDWLCVIHAHIHSCPFVDFVYCLHMCSVMKCLSTKNYAIELCRGQLTAAAQFHKPDIRFGLVDTIHVTIHWQRSKEPVITSRKRTMDDQIIQHAPETSMAKVSLLTPTRLKATHSTVILRLDGPTVRTLSTSTAPYSSLWTSTVGAWRGIAICSPEVFSLHLPHCNTYTVRQRPPIKAPRLQLIHQTFVLRLFPVQWNLRRTYPKTLVPDDSGSRIPKWGASECGYVFPSHHSNRSLCQGGEN